jgi:hypothetical protein
MTIPDPAGTNTIQIDGTVAAGQFGQSVLGIGQFYPSPAGSTLVVGAPPATALYAFRGQNPTGILTTANADDSIVSGTADQYGTNMGLLGPLGASPAALTVASTNGRYVDLHIGTATTGPFLGAMGGAPAASVRFVDTASSNSFGIVNIGGGIKGTSQVVSFIGGDATPDLVVAGQLETNNPLYVVNGAVMPSLSGTFDVSANANVSPLNAPVVKISSRLPTPWGGYAGSAVIIRSNNDVYPDFVVGESAFGAAGRVVVFY